MAGKTLQWVFQILDKMSGPGKKMAKVMGDLDKGIHGVSDRAKTATVHVGGFRHALFELGEIGHRALSFLGAVGSKIVDFGKEAIHAAEFKENTLLSLKYLLGSQSAAQEVFELAHGIATRTGSDIHMFEQFAQTLAEGFKNPAEIKTLLIALGDLSAIKPGAMETFASALSEVKKEGVGTLKQIRTLSMAGISGEDIYESLAASAGLAGDNIKKLRERLAEGGTVPAADMIKAIVETERKLAGGTIGDPLAEKSKTLENDMKRFENLHEQFFENLAGGKGFQAFRGMITNLVSLMSPGGPIGKSLTDLVNGPLADFLKQFSGPEGLKRLEDMLTTITDNVIVLTKALKDLAAVLGAIAGPLLTPLKFLYGADALDEANKKREKYPIIGPPAPVVEPSGSSTPAKVPTGLILGGHSFNFNIQIEGDADAPKLAALEQNITNRIIPQMVQALKNISTETGNA